jgi:hypothetical protein
MHWSGWSAQHACVELDSDRIRTDTNSDVTIYHILFEFGYEYECKTDISNSHSHSNTYSIYSIEL